MWGPKKHCSCSVVNRWSKLRFGGHINGVLGGGGGALIFVKPKKYPVHSQVKCGHC